MGVALGLAYTCSYHQSVPEMTREMMESGRLILRLLCGQQRSSASVPGASIVRHLSFPQSERLEQDTGDLTKLRRRRQRKRHLKNKSTFSKLLRNYID